MSWYGLNDYDTFDGKWKFISNKKDEKEIYK